MQKRLFSKYLLVSTHRCRRRLAEHHPILPCETAEFGESVPSGDLGNGCGRGVTPPQCGPYQVQSAQSSIVSRAHTQELRATDPQLSFLDTDRRTQFRDRQVFMAMRREDILKAGHDIRMTPSRAVVAVRLLGGKTVNQRMKEILLERPCDLLVCGRIRLGLGEPAGLRM
jgi:hypothetical protein